MEENDINNNLIIKTLRKRRLSTEPKFYVYSYTDPTNNIVLLGLFLLIRIVVGNSVYSRRV